jgi:hypothetical protein
MKVFTLLLTALICFSATNAQKKSLDIRESHRISKILSSQWTFNYFPDKNAGKGYESPGFDDSKWPVVNLPHSWNNYETTGQFKLLTNTDPENDNSYWWTGWGWYRKHFTIDRNYSDRKVFVEFKGVMQNCKVWLNGKYLGEHKSGYTSFDFDITTLIKPGEDNLLAVAVNNLQKDGFLINSGELPKINFYSGINREVTLILKDKLYLTVNGTSNPDKNTTMTIPQVSETNGAVRIQALVKNDNALKKNCILKTYVTDSTGKVVYTSKTEAAISPGQLFTFDQTDKPIKNFHLWSSTNQHLFKIDIEVIDGKEITDNYTGPLGSVSQANTDTSWIHKAISIFDSFSEANICHSDKNLSKTENGINSGEPVKVTLIAAEKILQADRGSVLILSSDIVDSKGVHIKGAKNTIKWSVTGPAILVGPAMYESESNKHHILEGIGYNDLPVSNVIRSTGKPGKIHITVSACGLVSSSLDIEALEIKPDNKVIIEPVLENEGRTTVARKALPVNRLEEIPREITSVADNINITPSDRSGYSKMIKSLILKKNPSVDSLSIEFNALVDLFATHLLNNNGHLSSGDYNLNVDHFNNSRLIAVYINSTKLPQLYKESLRKYYANSIIKLGSEKNAGFEMNWLNWIPSGGTVVVVQDENTKAGIKGVIYTKQTALADIISAVYPQFAGYSQDGRDRALIFTGKMNPYVVVSGTQNQGADNVNTTGVSYNAEKGQTILVPLLKFISE